MTTIPATVPPGAGAAIPATPRTGPAVLGKDDFLRLLIAQLRNQDPLNPLDQNQFLTQTAQFTALEHLQNIARGLETLTTAVGGAGLAQGTPLLGRTARLGTGTVGFDGVQPPALPFLVEGGPAWVEIEVLDAGGQVLRRLATGPAEPGPGALVWDGRDDAGRPATPGTYTYRVRAVGVAGGPARVVAGEGVITGLRLEGAGLVYRVGERTVRPDDIVEIH